MGTGGRQAKAGRSRGGQSTHPVLKVTVLESEIAAMERQMVARSAQRACHAVKYVKRRSAAGRSIPSHQTKGDEGLAGPKKPRRMTHVRTQREVNVFAQEKIPH